MNLLDILFPPKKKDKDSPDARFDDEDAQKYFKTSTANSYIKKLLMCNSKSYLSNADMTKLKEAYDKAHDIRKFEIELYWKRTTYVWTLIAALITVVGVLLGTYFRLDLSEESKNALLGAIAFVAIFGLFITIISQRILQSGEYWQKNWEYHVNLLEPLFSGRLYGTLLNGETERYSITKLNRFLYRLVLFLWVFLAEIIYRIVFDAANIYVFLIPLLIFAVIIAVIIKIIDLKTLRKTGTANILLSQWDVSFEEKNEPNNLKIFTINILKAALFIGLLTS